MVGCHDAVLAALEKQKPAFHILPPEGWINDPNGPIYYNGHYHMFYQYVERGCAWSWGLLWGHVVSKDLVNWTHMPPALAPTPGGFDGDGCFSGCATLDVDGTPTILYTGVRLRANELCGPLPPPECDLNNVAIETQCMARCDPDDPFLETWTKVDTPFITLPPPNMNLTAWRDPFVLCRPGERGQSNWTVMVGAGVHNSGGSALVYRSNDESLTSGWNYVGELCRGKGDTGVIWECPVIAQPPPLPRGKGGSSSSVITITATASSLSPPASPLKATPHATTSPLEYHAMHSRPVPESPVRLARAHSPQLPDVSRLQLGGSSMPSPHSSSSISPRQRSSASYSYMFAVCPDDCRSKPVYYLGDYNAETATFDLEAASGPFVLDWGDIFYAPNLMTDPQGRVIMWGWLQEKRTKATTHDYACCLSLSRLLYLDHTAAGSGRPPTLVQRPPPELVSLRNEHRCWSVENTLLEADEQLPITGVEGPYLDIEVELKRGHDMSSASCASAPAAASGLVFSSYTACEEGAAALLYDWETGKLEVIFEAVDPETHEFSLTAPSARRVGGTLHRPPAAGEPLQLRIFLDYSVLEVFTAQGEVLTVRTYRGAGQGSGINVVSLGGCTTVSKVEAWEMRSIWEEGMRTPAVDACVPSQHVQEALAVAEPLSV